MATLLLDSSNTSLSVGFENNGVLIGFTSYEPCVRFELAMLHSL